MGNERFYTLCFHVGVLVGSRIRSYLAFRKEGRDRIAEWEADRIAAIQAVSKRLEEAVADPDVSLSEFIEMYNEEMAFLDIITDINTIF